MASSLGRELTDEARERHLKNGTIAHYIEKGRGGIFADAMATRGLSPMALARHLVQSYPDYCGPWLTRIRTLSDAALRSIVEALPPERMNETSQRFVLAFLNTSRTLITDLTTA
jgi:hypothetical protein